METLIDGSQGGGQMLRSALLCSLLTQKPFRMINIRASRPKPGLCAQHLSCIELCTTLGKAQVEGNTLGSLELYFAPQTLEGGNITLDIGTAGSLTLLMQSSLLALLFAKGRSILHLTGGTDTQWSIPYDFFKDILLPWFTPYGKILLDLEERGYYPQGGGKIRLHVYPTLVRTSFSDMNSFVSFLREEHRPLSSHIPFQWELIRGVSYASYDLQSEEVAEQQTRACELALSEVGLPLSIRTEYGKSASSGHGMVLYAQTSDPSYRCGVDALGKGSPREVGDALARRLKNELSLGVLDPCQGDNLIPLLGLVGGTLTVSEITSHIRLNCKVVEVFFDVQFSIDEEKKSITAVFT